MPPDNDTPFDPRASEEADLRDHAPIWRDALQRIVSMIDDVRPEAFCVAPRDSALRLDALAAAVRLVASSAMDGVVVE